MKRHILSKHQLKTIPMAAMIDIVFLLLVFFIVTFQSQLVEAHLVVNMPTGGYGPRSPALLTLTVLPGRCLLLEREMPLDRIAAWLAQATVHAPDTTVLIKVSPEATEGELVRVLDLCTELKLTRLNLMTLKE